MMNTIVAAGLNSQFDTLSSVQILNQPCLQIEIYVVFFIAAYAVCLVWNNKFNVGPQAG